MAITLGEAARTQHKSRLPGRLWWAARPPKTGRDYNGDHIGRGRSTDTDTRDDRDRRRAQAECSGYSRVMIADPGGGWSADKAPRFALTIPLGRNGG
jgi:hypothetical protein